MKRFIKISAIPCNEKGEINNRMSVQIRKEMRINIDFIGAVDGDKIYLKEPLLKIGNAYFTDVTPKNIEDLKDL